MPCYCPIPAWYGAEVNPATGRRSLVFRKDRSHSGVVLQVPCGRCIGCKVERSRQWAIRCLHEMKLHKESCFLSLTYRQESLPALGSLVKRDLQLFMKRLRKRRPPGVRFYGCGEYGDCFGRPHYHVLLLNTSFPDMKVRRFGEEENVYSTYVSAELEELWPLGQSVIGSVTFDSCQYVAKYCTKVVTGDGAALHYGGREREFAVMSRRPGIGLGWFDRFNDEWYRHDSLVVDARAVPLVRYYDDKFDAANAGIPVGRLHDSMELIKKARRAKVDRADQSARRLMTRERLAKLTLAYFNRGEI